MPRVLEWSGVWLECGCGQAWECECAAPEWLSENEGLCRFFTAWLDVVTASDFDSGEGDGVLVRS